MSCWHNMVKWCVLESASTRHCTQRNPARGGRGPRTKHVFFFLHLCCHLQVLLWLVAELPKKFQECSWAHDSRASHGAGGSGLGPGPNDKKTFLLECLKLSSSRLKTAFLLGKLHARLTITHKVGQRWGFHHWLVGFSSLTDSVNIWCIVFFPVLKPLACGRQSRCLDWTYKLPGGQKFSIKLSPRSVGFPQRRPLNLIKRPQFTNSPGGRFINSPACSL